MRDWYSSLGHSRGRFTIQGVGCQILPMSTLAMIFRIFQHYCPDTDTVAYISGRAAARCFASGSKNLGEMLSLTGSLGMGNFEIISANKELKYILRSRSSPVAEQYLKTYGVQEKPVDSYISGFLSVLFEKALGEPFGCRESQCVSQGKHFCIYEVERKGLSLLEKEIDAMIGRIGLFVGKSEIQSPVLLQVLSNKLLVCNDGRVKLWDMAAVAMPAPGLATFNYLMTKRMGDQAGRLLHFIGRTQAEVAAEIQIKVFGYNRDSALFDKLLQQSELVGVGMLVRESDSEPILVRNTDNILVEIMADSFNMERSNWFLRGLLSGTSSSSYGKSLIAEEKESGKDWSLFHLTSGSEEKDEFLSSESKTYTLKSLY